MLPDYRTWAVRLYLGGAQRTLGLMAGTGDGFSRLLRFADMAKMHFWKYGVRTAHVPGDMELNFSAERANEDLKCEVHALGLLHDIENHLIDTKALLPPTERELARKMARLTKPTITRAMTELNHSLQARLQEVIEKLTAIQAELAELKSKGVAPPAWVASPPLAIRGSPVDPPFPDFTRPFTTGDPLLPRPITICGTTHLSPGNV
jgi:hypothetical protein